MFLRHLLINYLKKMFHTNFIENTKSYKKLWEILTNVLKILYLKLFKKIIGKK